MTLPPLLELVYEKVLSLSSEIGEYVSEVTNTGVGYGDTVASLVQKRTDQVTPSWMPKVWNPPEERKRRKRTRCYTNGCPPSIASKHECLPDRVNPDSCCPYTANYQFVARIPPVPFGEPPPLEGDDLICPPAFDPCLTEEEQRCEQTSTIIDSPIQNICKVVTPGKICVIEPKKAKVCKLGKKSESESEKKPPLESPPAYTPIDVPIMNPQTGYPNVQQPMPNYPLGTPPHPEFHPGIPPHPEFRPGTPPHPGTPPPNYSPGIPIPPTYSGIPQPPNYPTGYSAYSQGSYIPPNYPAPAPAPTPPPPYSSPNYNPSIQIVQNIPPCNYPSKVLVSTQPPSLADNACKANVTVGDPDKKTCSSNVPSGVGDYSKQYFSSPNTCYSVGVTTCSITSSSSSPSYTQAQPTTVYSSPSHTRLNPTSTNPVTSGSTPYSPTNTFNPQMYYAAPVAPTTPHYSTLPHPPIGASPPPPPPPPPAQMYPPSAIPVTPAPVYSQAYFPAQPFYSPVPAPPPPQPPPYYPPYPTPQQAYPVMQNIPSKSYPVPECPPDESAKLSSSIVPECPPDEDESDDEDEEDEEEEEPVVASKEKKCYPVPECPPDPVKPTDVCTTPTITTNTAPAADRTPASTCTVPSVVIIVNPVSQSSPCTEALQVPSLPLPTTPLCVSPEIQTQSECHPPVEQICPPVQYSPPPPPLITCNPPNLQQTCPTSYTNVNSPNNYPLPWNTNPQQNYVFTPISYPTPTYFTPPTYSNIPPLVGEPCSQTGNANTFVSNPQAQCQTQQKTSQSSGIFPTLNACSDTLPLPEVSLNADVCSRIFSPDAVCRDSEISLQTNSYAAPPMSIYTSSQMPSSYNNQAVSGCNDSMKEDACAFYLGDNSVTEGVIHESQKFVPTVSSRSPAGDSITQTLETEVCPHMENYNSDTLDNDLEDYEEDYPEYLSENGDDNYDLEDTTEIADSYPQYADEYTTKNNTDWEARREQNESIQPIPDKQSPSLVQICDVMVPICSTISDAQKSFAESKTNSYSAELGSGQGKNVHNMYSGPIAVEQSQSTTTQYVPQYIPPSTRPRTPPTVPSSSEIYAEAMRTSKLNNVDTSPPCPNYPPPVCPPPVCSIPACPPPACPPPPVCSPPVFSTAVYSAPICSNSSACQDACNGSCGPPKAVYASSQCVSGPGHPYCGSPPSRSPHSHSHTSGHHHRHYHKERR